MKQPHNNVDYSQRTAEPRPGGTLSREAIADGLMQTLKEFYPYGFRMDGQLYNWDPESVARLREVLIEDEEEKVAGSDSDDSSEDRPFNQDAFFRDPQEMQRTYDRRNKKL